MGSRARCWLVVLSVGLVWPSPAGRARAAAPAKSAAPALMKRGLYRDAIRALLKEIQGRPEAECGRQLLMLAESCYMSRDYGRARPYFLKAAKHCRVPRDRLIAEYRLACCAYRLGDRSGAVEKIDAFAKAHPSDRRTGTLLLFKMKVLAGRGRAAQADLEAVHKRVSETRAYGHAARAAADKVLTEFYLAGGQEDKARQRYAGIVHRVRSAINECEQEKRPIPKGLEQAHDHAAMQLGVLHVKAKRLDEAVRWLENVRYDAALKQQARLLLAQAAYQRRDFDRAIRYLTRDELLETVPPGSLRSDMCLLLGLCEKSRSKPDPARVVSYLKQVGPGAKGYFQAQAGLADLYRDRGLADLAIGAYEKAAASPKYEAEALFQLGRLRMTKADGIADRAQQAALYRRAAEHFGQLSTKYPASLLAKRAGASIEALLSKGYNVSLATTDAERVRRWQEAARKKPGSAGAARALINIARLHHKAVLDEKTRRFVKAPNHLACAAACDKLLDGKAYTGAGLEAETWQGLQVEARYYRGLSHLASAGAPKAAGPIQPTYVKGADLKRALADLTAAREQVDPKQLDLVRNIELALLEAMFKSGEATLREQARARFAELVNEYGTDVRFQKLAMDLAEWYRRQGRYADAAGEYKGIADRGANLPQEDVLKALFLAGKLYSKAAHEARTRPGARRFGIYIHPKEVLKIGDLRKTYPPLQKQIRVVMPKKRIEATKALELISKAAGVPFVWGPKRTKDSIADYLRRKRVDLAFVRGTVAEFLEQVLDFEHHRLAFDIGMTGGEATFTPKPPDEDDPDRAGAVRVLEVYDVRREADRYPPMARKYGPWRTVHRSAAMMFNVVRRVEELTGTKVLWAEGLAKEDVLAAEFERVPGADDWRSLTCGQVLARLLATRELRFRIVPRDRSAELYDLAKEAFNDIRKIDPRSTCGENSLFLLAINFYRQEDYERMKIVLKEYLKLFDSPSHEHYHEACFWVGWVFEHEKRYRDACRWYNRVAEERLVVFKPAKDERTASEEQLRARLSYDTLFALEESVTGQLKDATLDGDLVELVKVNSNVPVRLEAGAAGIDAPINHGPFTKAPVLRILCDVLAGLGLSFRAENVNEAVAAKALYRLAAAYKKDELMPQALTSCNVLLARYPETPRRVAAYKLKLEVYKALKDYRSVLATLEELKTRAGGQIEPYKIDFEIAWIYFDLCRYDRAAEAFRKSLAAAKDPGERINIRDGYARALFRAGQLAEALGQYRALAKGEPGELRAFVHRMMVWYLQRATGETAVQRLPDEAARLIEWYVALSDDKRDRLGQSTLAKVTWIYYVAGLLDLDKGRRDDALAKLKAAGNSPDDWLAADAIYRTGTIQMKAGRLDEAKETLEYLLFSTKSAEAEVKATFALACCHEALGDARRARLRWEQVLRRFPDSSYAESARRRLAGGGPASKPATSAAAPP